MAFGIDDLILGGLSLGGSLLSGLGAQSSAKKQAKIEAAYQYQNYLLQVERNNINKQIGIDLVDRYGGANIAQDAYKAGYNPVTWLGAMGGMYGNLTQYGESLKVGTDYMQSAPTTQVPSTLSVIGNAISAGASTLNSASQNSKRVDAQNFATTMQYVSNVQKMRASGNSMAGLGTPFFESAGQVLSGGGAAAALSLGRMPKVQPSKLNDWGLQVKPPEASTPSWMGVGDQSISGAQTAQDAYDWPLSIPFGAVKFGADVYRKFTGRQFMGDFWADNSEMMRSGLDTWLNGRSGSDRTQAHQAEADQKAFGSLPWFARRMPGLDSWKNPLPPAVPFWENPYVYQ
ncbi:MAG: hypothetical protein [Microviridae sp.]|nr:MAG: hypothetical protein [Microviridae sp.]